MTGTLTPDAGEASAGTRRGSLYARLSRQVQAAGLLRRRRLAYAALIAATMLLFAGTIAAIVLIGDSWWQLLAAIALGVAFTQVAFLGHDGGHQQMFSSRHANDLVGRLVGNLLVGLSYGWWVGKHNRHHANPNKEDHDPDIGDGVLAFTTTQIAARTRGLGRVIARRQAWLFFPLLTLEGLHLHVSSVRALLPHAERSARGGSRPSEALLLFVHLGVYIGGLLLVMSPLKVVMFVADPPSGLRSVHGLLVRPEPQGHAHPYRQHGAGLSAPAGADLPQRARRPVHRLVVGGLNYQIEHHLFPNMPRSSLRRAQPLVQDFCAENGVCYTETSLIGSYRAALSHLNSLGAPLRSSHANAYPP